MQQLIEKHIFNGMQRDLSVSKHPAQFIYDGLNVRLTAREKDTLLSITNEKGTFDTEMGIAGIYLGHCMLNQYLVVFSYTSEKSWIYRIDLSQGTPDVVPLYGSLVTHTSLGFSSPIDAISSYESEAIQKVYWTDGVNQPRMINIAPLNDDRIDSYNSNSFEFIQDLALNEVITIKKLFGAAGQFAPGVIQYAFTYYNKYGQESNIFYTSPIVYISPKDRGGSPEEKVDNSFMITVSFIEDDSFDYLRIYSIQRTSLNATPICRRVQDIQLSNITNHQITYVDNGIGGDSIDPTELLYKGGESIRVGTLEQKDNTLFFGNIKITRDSIGQYKNYIKRGVEISPTKRTFNVDLAFDNSDSIVGGYRYGNQLSAKDNDGNAIPCAGFKCGDYYRLGIQFQYKTGKWSDPIFIKDDYLNIGSSYRPSIDSSDTSHDKISVPCFDGELSSNVGNMMLDAGYKKVRAVVVYPNPNDRQTLCQGILNPTLYTTKESNHKYSSWFFRPALKANASYIDSMCNVSPVSEGTLTYMDRGTVSGEAVTGGNPSNIRQVEIQGCYDPDDKFNITHSVLTFHSPDIEWDSNIQNLEFNGLNCSYIGTTNISTTYSDIDIQTETPTISGQASGFIHDPRFAGKHLGSYGIVSGFFYDDFMVDDSSDDATDPSLHFRKWDNEKVSFKWMIYPWQKTGSLNNDINRPAGNGTASAILKKKVISNLRFAKTNSFASLRTSKVLNNPQLFNSEEGVITKVGNTIYYGNVDTVLNPKETDGLYFAHVGDIIGGLETDISVKQHEVPSGTKGPWWKTFSLSINEANQNGPRYWNSSTNRWEWDGSGAGNVGDAFLDLSLQKGLIRMKYKSTPHLVFEVNSGAAPEAGTYERLLWLAEITRYGNTFPPTKPTTLFGGESEDAFRANIWIPCGEPVTIVRNENTPFQYSWGDTYYQRWDCLKTYPFTREDINQIVEIASFMVETHTNIDGRYDRNRGQVNNINMSPTNFNLLNSVYSQLNNFFSYRIMPDDYYENTEFPNQITWSKEKQPGADIDLWTNITLASTYNMDGSKDRIISLNAWKDNLYCFQKKGISVILFNSRVQIPVSDGMPIEISNNYKVDGYRYISDGMGCNDKKLIKETPSGIYFIDSVGSHLLHIGDNGLQDLSEKCNMTTWFKDNAGNIVKTLFDDINHDVYLIQGEGGKALCFSEKLGQFTGFYNYEGISLIETCNNHVFAMKDENIWKMFEGYYCQFFGENRPWSLTFISNGGNNMTLDKTFTNLEFRACVEGEGTKGSTSGSSVFDETFDYTFRNSEEIDADALYVPFIPIDYLEVWNEYQHGIANIDIKSGHALYQHHKEDGDANIGRKFRIWRCDIPRDNYPLTNGKDVDRQKGIYRFYRKPMDRMRNPWLCVKIQKDAAEGGKHLYKTELHDLQVIYYS